MLYGGVLQAALRAAAFRKAAVYRQPFKGFLCGGVLQAALRATASLITPKECVNNRGCFWENKQTPFLLTHLFGGVPKACGLVVAICSLLVASV